MKPKTLRALVIVGLIWWLAPRASAQLGSLIVAISSPTSGATVSDTTTVRGSVTIIGFLTVGGVQFQLDGDNLGAEDTTPPYSIDWDTTGASNGWHTLTAVARDRLGLLRFTSDPVTVMVSNSNDNTPPTVTITSPQSGESLSGTTTVTAEASDDVEVAGVQFFVDATPLGTEVNTAPYSVFWDTTRETNGSHTLTAIARDSAGNTATSAGVTVTVANSGAAVTRIEETSTAVSYTGTWQQGNTDRPWSGGTAAVSTEAAAQATLAFSGTEVSWIGFRGPQTGIARVFLDGTLVATVDTYATAEEVQAVIYTAKGLADAAHTLTIEVTGTKNDASSDFYIVVDAFDVTSSATGTSGGGTGEMFAPGDVFVSLETGPVQEWNPNGTLAQTLTGTVPGTGEGIGFDPGGNLYVTRWCADPACQNGNTVERFNTRGQSQGTFGRGYDCGPHAIVFDAAGAAYVGQGGCRGSILKFEPGRADPIEFVVAPENQGAFWIDLAPDGCTIYYTSYGPNVKRFDVCAGVQLQDFNTAPVPGGEAQDLRVLPDGGVLVSSGDVIARLNASGAVVQTYAARSPSPDGTLWAGLDLLGDGTFWAGDYKSSNVYRFDLASGAVVSGFNTGTPPRTVVGVRVKK